MMTRPWPASGWNCWGLLVPWGAVGFRAAEMVGAELRHMDSTGFEAAGETQCD